MFFMKAEIIIRSQIISGLEALKQQPPPLKKRKKGVERNPNVQTVLNQYTPKKGWKGAVYIISE